MVSILFADDIKIFKTISSLSDNLCLQSNLQRLLVWCVNNRLQLNFSKCKVLRFYRCLSPQTFDYHMESQVLDAVADISDLAVIFDKNLSFLCISYVLPLRRK